MNHDTIRKSAESTPFKAIQLGNLARLELYWTKNIGVYGNQVMGVLFDGDYTTDENFFRSSGCGYCKESHITELALRKLGKKPSGHKLGGESISWKFRQGGNFYRVPENKMVNI